MRINELENLLKISRANIRFYEKEGLISPSRKDNGYREYDEEDVEILKRIIIYRKIGISISDIKDIFAGVLSLNDAANKSVSLLEQEITSLNISVELCNEICKSGIDDENLDADYYWREICERESTGEEFFNFADIDISGFNHKKRIKVATIVFIAIFFIGIFYSLACSKSYKHNNEYYDLKLPEINTLCKIDTVKTDVNNKILYVCYDEATCVNAYDFDGNFLWAVSTPHKEYSRGVTYFYLTNQNLIIERDADVYIYNALTGDFLEKTYLEKLNMQSWRDTYESYHDEDITVLNQAGYEFDLYNVYTKNNNEKQINYIVKKPSWYLLTNDIWGFILAVIGAIGMFLISVSSSLKKLKKLPLNHSVIGKKANAFVAYLRILFSSLIAFSITDIFLALFGIANISIAIFPIAGIFTLSLITEDIITKRFNKEEKRFCNIWRNYLMLAFFATIVCVVIALFFSNI